jgi:YD repeat-containing protein
MSGTRYNLHLDGRGSTYYAYTVRSELASEKLPDGTAVYFAYDAAGRRTSLQVSGVGTAYYAYDLLGRVSTVVTPSGKAAYYEYDPEGAVTKRVLPNGAVSYFAYDPAGRVASISHLKSDMSTVAYFGYTYSPGGNILSIRREGGDIIYYSYDFRSRLTGETWYTEAMSSIYAFEYAYDGAGNRTRKTRDGQHTYYEYDIVNRLLRAHDASADTWTYFEYDQRGNTTLIQQPSGTTYFGYSDRDLQSSIHYRTGTWNYFYYDGQMRRYALQDSGGLRYFTHDTDGLCRLAERNAAGTVLAAHARGYAPVPGIGDALESRIEAAGGTYYQYDLSDPQGNVVAVLDAAQNVTGRFEYSAWGEKLCNEPPPEGTRFGQSAPAWMHLPDDPDDVLRPTPTRTYHAGLGRFLQRDFVRRPNWSSRYAYAGNRVPLDVDPLGLRTPLKDKKLRELSLYALQAVGKQGWYNWRPSLRKGEPAPPPWPTLSLMERAAWYCAEGIRSEMLLDLVGQIGKEAMKTPYRVAKFLLSEELYEELLEKGKEAAKKALEEELKKALAEVQTQTMSRKPEGDCFCEFTMFYDPYTKGIKGVIVGRVGRGVSRAGDTDCCQAEDFFFVFQADAVIEESSFLFWKVFHVRGVENFAWLP